MLSSNRRPRDYAFERWKDAASVRDSAPTKGLSGHPRLITLAGFLPIAVAPNLRSGIHELEPSQIARSCTTFPQHIR